MNNPSSHSDRWFKTRAVAFCLLAAWILLAPGYRQILGGQSRYVRPWVMYIGVGLGLVDAEFYLLQPDGGTMVLDRFDALGYEDRKEAPEWLRRIRGRENFRQVIQALSDQLEPEADLRVVARMAVRRGWRTLSDGQESARALIEDKPEPDPIPESDS